MKIYDELKDQVVLVTGGTQGIGEAMAREFTAQKVNLAINGRRLDAKVQKVLDATGAFPAMGDISDTTAAKRIVEETVAKFGRIDVLVGNAAGMSMMPFLEQEELNWWDQVNINLTGHLASIRAALPYMIKQKRGTIILVSSFFGTLGWPNATGYGSTKTALLTLAQYISREYKQHNIRACIIVPGIIRTPQLQVDADDLGVSYDEMCEIYSKEAPQLRVGKPEEIATMAVYMSTAAGGRALSGRHVQVSGGAYRSTPYYV